MRANGPRVLCACALLAVTGCNDHRYGFFGDSEGESGSGSTTIDVTTTFAPTTVSPTTITTTSTTFPPTTGPTTITTTGPTTITTEPVTSVTTVTTVGPTCGELFLPSAVPTQGVTTVSGGQDSFSLSCGGIGGSDVAFVWNAPFSGRFAFDTKGSSFDALIGVIDGFCGGPELGCDDDNGGDLAGRVEVDLFAGQLVTIIVDSFGTIFGDVVVNVDEVPAQNDCPDGDFGSMVPIEIPGQTAGAADSRGGSCGGFGASDIEAVWTAPFSGTFRVELTASDFDPVMYLLFDSCEGFEFACSDDGNGLNPVIETFFEAGQRTVIVVDGNGGTSGKFTLAINAI